jgi:hypothetical protein
VRKMRERDLDPMVVSASDASVLRFPPGRPQKHVVYVGHPVAPVLYYPAGSLHESA